MYNPSASALQLLPHCINPKSYGEHIEHHNDEVCHNRHGFWILKCLTLLCSRVGDELLKAGKWDEAKALYWRNAKRLVGDQFQIPGISGSSGGGGLRSAQYTNMGHFERANLMGCCNGMAKCYIHEKDIESVCGSHGSRLVGVLTTCTGPCLAGRGERTLPERILFCRASSTIW